MKCLLNWAYLLPTEQGLKGAYSIGLNHVIFVPTKQGLIMLCLLNWAYLLPTEQGLKGAYLIGLNHVKIGRAHV